MKGWRKILLGLVMGDFSTQMYVERKNLRNFAFDLVMGGKPPQMYYERKNRRFIS